jgi:vacuolar-type H+-ATPase catalytic subunit A/Vma1
MDPGPFGSKVLVFDDQHNLWTNVFAIVYVRSS